MNRPPANSRSEFAEALRKGLLLGAAFLVVSLPPVLTVRSPAPQSVPPLAAGVPPSPAATPPAQLAVARHADFRRERASQDARRMANWIVQSGDHQRRSFVIVDKKDARVYVFDPAGRLQSAAPALLGQSHGDDTVPGIGNKPVAEVLPQERTTPAGRFVAELGASSSRGEDVVWVDYDAAVSMHRVLKKPERLKALASPTKDDNRMSYGCINLPPPFYEKVLRPAVQRTGAIIYVLPETRPLHEVFASFQDVNGPVRLAQRAAP
ncbi:hypothetical protein [Ramlibacter sp.]|uniref:hypothetical protein n=1 Tax=Ramlibacter sp. TaxID=1917967 RepID=UPI002C07A56F|nr:hypothetical protein [Ramlibacter sp.]HWI83913.1 hypothetical protein [Ramlibacter sp.]